MRGIGKKTIEIGFREFSSSFPQLQEYKDFRSDFVLSKPTSQEKEQLMFRTKATKIKFSENLNIEWRRYFRSIGFFDDRQPSLKCYEGKERWRYFADNVFPCQW